LGELKKKFAQKAQNFVEI